MTTVKDIVRRIGLLVGRKKLYKASHFLLRTARGDYRNDFQFNGEKMVQRVALHSGGRPVVVFDVGANVGNWTAGMLEQSERSGIPVHVYAFEPVLATFCMLADRFKGRSEVTLTRKACSRRPGTAAMRIYEWGGGTNSLAEPIDNRNADFEQVEITTIDGYCEATGIESIDFLKVDAEGYDLEVMAGASRMLDHGAIRILQFEYNHRWIGARNFLKDVFALLEPRGYLIGKIVRDHVEFYPYWQWELETWDEGNYVSCLEKDVAIFRTAEPKWIPFDHRNGRSFLDKK